MSGVLTYGGYSCVAEHAVQESFILSTATAAYFRDQSAGFDIGEILMDYVKGDLSVEETIGLLNEDLEDTNEAAAIYEARDDES